MQTQPNKITQVLLTAVGLFLLVLAMTLNHYHPRNEGIATITHNNIYRLKLDVVQTPIVGLGAPKLANDAVARVYNPPQVVENPQSIPVAPEPKTDNQPSSSAPDGQLLPNEAACSQIDAKKFIMAQKNYDASYKEYSVAKSKSENSYKSDTSQSGDKEQTYYQSYLNALESDFTAYRLAVLNNGCQPSHPAPAPQDS